MKIDIGNVFAGISKALGQEQFQTLFENSAVKIERIVSQSYSSPETFWYDQAEPEWVIVLLGAATLEFETAKLVALNPGDHVMIPSHTKHRIHHTGPETVWLAVHVKGE